MRGRARFRGRSTTCLLALLAFLAVVPALSGCGDSKESFLEQAEKKVNEEWEEMSPAEKRAELRKTERNQRRWETQQRKCPEYAARQSYAVGPEGGEVASLKIGCGDLGQWPLKVKSGLLQCEEEVSGGFVLQKVWFTAPDGTVYGVNGTAQDAGYPGIDSIWKNDPAGYGLKINIGPLIDRGLKLCS